MNKVNLLVTEIDTENVIVTVLNEYELLDKRYILSILCPEGRHIMSKKYFNESLFKIIKTHRVDIITPEVSLEELEEELHDLRRYIF